MAKTTTNETRAKTETKNGSCIIRKDSRTGRITSKSNDSEDKNAKRKALTLKAFKTAYDSHQKKG